VQVRALLVSSDAMVNHLRALLLLFLGKPQFTAEAEDT